MSANSVSLSSGKARAHSTHRIPHDADVATLAAAIERNVIVINERINDVQQEIDQEVSKLEQSINAEQYERVKSDNMLQEKLQATGTGGLHISAIGAVWLFVGVILSSVPAELAKLLTGDAR